MEWSTEFDRYFKFELYMLSERTVSGKDKEDAEKDMKYIMTGQRDKEKEIEQKSIAAE
jgi:hypothetical protein